MDDKLLFSSLTEVLNFYIENMNQVAKVCPRSIELRDYINKLQSLRSECMTRSVPAINGQSII